MKNLPLFKITWLIAIMVLAAHALNGQHKYTEWYTTYDPDPFVNGEGSNFNNIVSDGESIIANGVYTTTGNFQGIDLPEAVGKNAMITKMDLNGDYQWISTLTGSNIDAFYDMVVDSEGNIILVGWTSSSGSIEINEEEIYYQSQDWTNTSLIVKLSGEDGSLIWSTHFEGLSYTAVNSIRMAIDTADNVYIGGYYSSDFSVGDIDVDYNQTFGNDIFVLRFDAEGTVEWAQTIECEESGGYASTKALAVIDETLFVGIDYYKSYIAGDSTLPYEGEFYWNGVVKFDIETGDIGESKAYGMDNAEGYQIINQMEADDEGNLVLVGYFNGDYTLEGDDFSISGLGMDESYIIKIDSNLNTEWAKSAGCESIDRIFNVDISEAGDIFLNGGFFNGEPFVFEGVEVLEISTPPATSKFELILDADGEFIDAYGLYGYSGDAVITSSDAVFVYNNDVEYLFCAGSFINNVEFMEDTVSDADHAVGYVFAWDISESFITPNEDCEYFDDLDAGDYVAEQLGGFWTTWSGTPGGADDPLVSDAMAYSAPNSFVIDNTSADLILQMADQALSSGTYHYSHYMYVPSGNSGYFNVQSEPTPGVAWVIELYFDDGGTGSFAGQSTETFEYTQDEWFLVEINFDLNTGWSEVLFDGELILLFENANTIGGINYYGSNSGGEPGAYYDDVCIQEGYEIDPYCEDFDELLAGEFVAEQLGGLWTTWTGTPGGADDAPIVDEMAYSTPNAFAVNSTSVDLVKQLGTDPMDEGQWVYSHMINVPTGYSGYFNVQSEPTPGVDWVVEVFFDDGGSGSIVENGNTTTFYYTQDQWFMVELNFDLDSDMAQMLFDGYEVHQWVSAFTIGGIDYWGSDAGGAPGAYFDDVCFAPGWTLEPPVLDPPTNLEASVIDGDENIYLTWDEPGSVGGTEELIYDNDESTGAYIYNGYTMSTHMTPASSCKVLTLRFHTTGLGDFNATIFGWAGTQPGTQIVYEENAMTLDGNWVDVDVSGEDITFDGDFVVGFGSINALAFLSYDSDLDNGRSWDYNNTEMTWTTWFEAYLIRAVVEYTDGSTEELGAISDDPVLVAPGAVNSTHPTDYTNVETVEPINNIGAATEALLGYNVYYQHQSSGFDLLDYTTETEYIHEGMALITGLHEYYITAVYDEGESDVSNTAEVVISGIENILENNLNIFPNPAKDFVTIQSDNIIESVTIYNFAGQAIVKEKADSHAFRVNVSSYNPGVYIFRIDTDNGSINKYIVVGN